MTMTKVEEVARALCSLHYAKRFNLHAFDYRVRQNVEGNWHMHEDEARAAIAAMKGPTEAMVDAMDEHAGTIAPEYAYEAAIDAALNEPPQSDK